MRPAPGETTKTTYCFICGERSKTPDYLVAYGCSQRMEVDIFGYCAVHFHESLNIIKTQQILCWHGEKTTHPYDDVLIHGVHSGRSLWPLMYGQHVSEREVEWIEEKTLAG